MSDPKIDRGAYECEELQHDNHVLLYLGFDLSAAGVYHHLIANCPFCKNRRLEDCCLLLTEELLFDRWIKFVACGDCGVRGPWGRTESEGLRLWNALAHQEKEAGTNGAH